jgi:hypothetical protein
MRVSFRTKYRDLMTLYFRQWSAIQKLVRTRSHLFLYVMQHGAMTIPKQAFDSDKAHDWFLATLPGEGGSLATH